MEWYHFLIAIGACFIITCAEVLFDYSVKQCLVVYTSIHFLYWLILNMVVAVAIFIANIKLKFISDSDPYTLAVFIGISGFLLVNSNMKTEDNSALSNVKSFLSQKKSKMRRDINHYIKVDYPRKQAVSLYRCFNYETYTVDEFAGYVKMVIKDIYINDKEKEEKYLQYVDEILDISYMEDKQKVYLLSSRLFELDITPWIKKDIFVKFCGSNMITTVNGGTRTHER
jgi:hypothetical protein